MILTLLLGALFALVFFVIAELFGRSRHIGRWWTFFLLWGGMIIPGVIALLLSPSARKEPFKGNSLLEMLGIVLSVVGIITLGMTLASWNEIDHIFVNIPIQILVVGFYLITLGKGNVINNNPKFYNEIIASSGFFGAGKKLSISSSSNLYYLSREGNKEGPFSYEQLSVKRLFEDDFVWRMGFENWMLAKDIPELASIVVFHPPPLPNVEI
jgi:hypothetical protein